MVDDSIGWGTLLAFFERQQLCQAEGGVTMAEFKRIKIRATLATGVMLLTDADIDRRVAEVCSKLKDSGLTLESVEAEEQAPVNPEVAITAYDGKARGRHLPPLGRRLRLGPDREGLVVGQVVGGDAP